MTNVYEHKSHIKRFILLERGVIMSDIEERKIKALELIASRLWWIALWLFLKAL